MRCTITFAALRAATNRAIPYMKIRNALKVYGACSGDTTLPPSASDDAAWHSGSAVLSWKRDVRQRRGHIEEMQT
jgi:hypothetical protein